MKLSFTLRNRGDFVQSLGVSQSVSALINCRLQARLRGLFLSDLLLTARPRDEACQYLLLYVHTWYDLYEVYYSTKARYRHTPTSSASKSRTVRRRIDSCIACSGRRRNQDNDAVRLCSASYSNSQYERCRPSSLLLVCGVLSTILLREDDSENNWTILTTQLWRFQ